MGAYDKPSSVLYSDLKSFGKIAHKRAVNIMLNSRAVATLDDSRISRDVVNAEPGSDIEFHYKDFTLIADELTSLLIDKHGGGDKGRLAVLAHYANSQSPAVLRMCSALNNYGSQPGSYINTLDRLSLNRRTRDRQKCANAVLLFVACGALGDPEKAIALADKAFHEAHGTSIGTVVASTEDSNSHGNTLHETGLERLGLLRVVGGVATTPLYELALPPEMTTIGSRDCTIMDVAPDVSRKHLAIWHDGNRWVCQGLSSLNGTTMISAADHTLRTVELPREQKGTSPSPICELAPGDTLCLGSSTRFLITSLSVG